MMYKYSLSGLLVQVLMDWSARALFSNVCLLIICWVIYFFHPGKQGMIGLYLLCYTGVTPVLKTLK